MIRSEDVTEGVTETRDRNGGTTDKHRLVDLTKKLVYTLVQ